MNNHPQITSLNDVKTVGHYVAHRLPRTTPQLRTIAKHLKNHGTITNVEAHAVYGIRSVSSRIAELRKLGLSIAKDQRKDATGQRYTRYRLQPGYVKTEVSQALYGSAN